MGIFSRQQIVPNSTDLAGWKQAVDDGSFRQFEPEVVVAALQDLGPQTDQVVRNRLALHISDVVLRHLRKLVGVNRNDYGSDVIDQTHGTIIEALLQPKSADGKGLRVAFKARISMRLMDAIRAEQKHEKLKDKLRRKFQPGRGGVPHGNTEAGDPAVHYREADVNPVDVDGLVDIDEAECIVDHHVDLDEDKKSDHAHKNLDWIVAKTDPRDDILENIDVSRALDKVIDWRKRLAFRWFIEGVPLDSMKDNTVSIARAFGVSGRTIQTWIDDVQTELKATVGEGK